MRSKKISIRTNENSWRYPGNTETLILYGPPATTVGDFNRDTKLDLVVANGGNGSISVLLGFEDGTFQNQMKSKVGEYPFSVTINDFNEDHILDLAVTSMRTISLLLGNGNGVL